MVFYVNKTAFFKNLFYKSKLCVWYQSKKHILVDLEQFENEIQPSPPFYAVSNYF